MPMEPAITLVRDVIRKSIAETCLMSTTAVSNVRARGCSGGGSTGQLCMSLHKFVFHEFMLVA